MKGCKKKKQINTHTGNLKYLCSFFSFFHSLHFFYWNALWFQTANKSWKEWSCKEIWFFSSWINRFAAKFSVKFPHTRTHVQSIILRVADVKWVHFPLDTIVILWPEKDNFHHKNQKEQKQHWNWNGFRYTEEKKWTNAEKSLCILRKNAMN